MEQAVKGVADESVIDIENLTKDTAEEAQPSVVSAANSVTESINPTGNGVGNAIKDQVEEVNSSVIPIENAVKATDEEVKPFDNYDSTGDGVGNPVNDEVEEVNPSVITVENAAKVTDEEVNPSDNHNSKLYDEQLVGVELNRLSQENFPSDDVKEQASQWLQDSQEPRNLNALDIRPIEYKNLQQRLEEFKRNQQETTQESKQKRSLLQTEKINKATGILLGAVTISLIGAIWGFTSRQNLLATKSPESDLAIKSPELGTIPPKSNLETKSSQLATKSPTSNQSLNSTPKTTPKTLADGWIFLGNINKGSASGLVGKSLIKGSASINSSVVPSVGSIVTVSVTPGVTLRKNRPQAPNFNAKEQKALAIIKPTEKLKILKVESIAPSNTTRPATPATKIWAQVDRCGSSCN